MIVSPISNATEQTSAPTTSETQAAGESFAGDWLLADSQTGQTILTFTSFIEAAVKRGGTVAYEPIEKGSFASYNKSSDPLNAIVTVAITGTKADIQNAIDFLDNLQKSTVTFSFVSPVKEFENLTLETFSWKWERTQGADVLYVEMALVEIREVEMLYTDTAITSSAGSATGTIAAADAKNLSDADVEERGVVVAETPSEGEKKTANSGLYDIYGVIY